MRISHRLLIPVVILSLVTLAVFAVSAIGFRQEKQANINMIRLDLMRYHAGEIRSLSRAVQRDTLNTLVERAEDRKAYADRATKRIKELNARVDLLSSIMGAETAALQMDGFAPTQRQVMSSLTRVIDTALAGNISAAHSLFNDETRPAERAASKVTDSFVEVMDKRIETATQESKALAILVERAQMITAVVGIVIGVGLALLITRRGVSEPLARLTTATSAIAAGQLDTNIPAQERRDELGALARALLIFRDQARANRDLEEQAALARAAAAQQRRQALQAMADTVASETNRTVDTVSQSTRLMGQSMQHLSSLAASVADDSAAVASASAQGLANAQAVSSAAEELSASIQEISGSVQRAATVIGTAVAGGNRAQETIASLSQAVERISEVTVLIGEIAQQTNLLALNATIEAARAGDAGKGFAVVAGEVKSLATQTARSTDDITRQISDIQSATRAAVEAMANVSTHIEEVNGVVTIIAAAMEEQGAATQEIARNVSETSRASLEVTERIGNVSQGAGEVDQRAGDVARTIAVISQDIGTLRDTLIQVVEGASKAA
ncbi:methyl-accepting chemotaxis protein [Niveispirillum sp. BGYR6]|uniref:methyl-accepting chemotaxis protein n=1 Tax=Niveispirillum sp. BGYR6 TaxID=2971249 RepID=UPI0022B9C160|nr:methyl-accepting chemotaxis protein [Niveispirillum sp. BGYR6]MDG5497593.1 methyl-accepting chemotaxis protein [Niveispirillum sp. BGYR6]